MVKLLPDDLFSVWSGSDHETAELLATFPSDRTLLWLPRFLLSSSSLTLLRHWASPPLAHEVATSGPGRGILLVLAWCVVCGVHPVASVRVRVGKSSPSCLVIRRVDPVVVAPPADSNLQFGSAPAPALVPAPTPV